MRMSDRVHTVTGVYCTLLTTEELNVPWSYPRVFLHEASVKTET